MTTMLEYFGGVVELVELPVKILDSPSVLGQMAWAFIEEKRQVLPYGRAVSKDTISFGIVNLCPWIFECSQQMAPRIWNVKECIVKMAMQVLVANVSTGPVPVAIPPESIQINWFHRSISFPFGFSQKDFELIIAFDRFVRFLFH